MVRANYTDVVIMSVSIYHKLTTSQNCGYQLELAATWDTLLCMTLLSRLCHWSQQLRQYFMHWQIVMWHNALHQNKSHQHGCWVACATEVNSYGSISCIDRLWCGIMLCIKTKDISMVHLASISRSNGWNPRKYKLWL